MQLAFIGLGVMGFPMAGHLSRAGHKVSVFNRSVEKARAWAQIYSGVVCETAQQAAAQADIVFACVGNDDDVRALTLGPRGAFSAMSRDGIFVDHTTTSADLARALHVAAREQSVNFLDAPVSGGQAGAEQGKLSVMVGGDEVPFNKVAPLMACYAKFAKRIGPSGSGQLTKMVNQICLTGLIEALAEGLYFAERMDLDVQTVIEAISQGAAQSWQMENRGLSMTSREFDFGFAVDLMRKDLGIVLRQAESQCLRLPIVEQVDSYYQEIQAMGGHRWDTSSLIARYDGPKS